MTRDPKHDGADDDAWQGDPAAGCLLGLAVMLLCYVAGAVGFVLLVAHWKTP